MEASRTQAQTFSVANVSAILEKVRDKLPLITTEARVGAVGSRSEVAFASDSVEFVDVTRPTVKLFGLTEQTLEMLDQLEAKPPVPFYRFPADPTK